MHSLLKSRSSVFVNHATFIAKRRVLFSTVVAAKDQGSPAADTDSGKPGTNPSSSEPSAAGETRQTHFGYQSVPEGLKSSLVEDVFRKVANKYDIMNDTMSLGIHRLWKDYFVSKLNPIPGTVHVDAAGGTGDISFRIARKVLEKKDAFPGLKSKIVVFDINASMLAVGRERALHENFSNDPNSNVELDWVQGDAENLPFESNSVDSFTIAFGIRNCTHVDQVCREAHRVLKPGGRFLCLEFSRVENPILRVLYDTYSFNVIPPMGQAITGDPQPYQYLVESIRQFPPQEEFAHIIRQAGFQQVRYENLQNGIAAIHSGFKNLQ